MSRVLIAEEEVLVTEGLRAALEREGFAEVTTAFTGEEALDQCSMRPFDVAILDVAPDINGFELAVALRQNMPNICLLFLTERHSLADKLMGFGVGADDFVSAPVEPQEIVARVRALLRRRGANAKASRHYDFGRFQILADEGRLVVEGRDVTVPARELRLLSFLAANKDTIYQPRDIYRAVWGEDPVSPTDENTVGVHVYRLRRRIEPDPTRPRYLVNIHGLGYKLVHPESEREPGARAPA